MRNQYSKQGGSEGTRERGSEGAKERKNKDGSRARECEAEGGREGEKHGDQPAYTDTEAEHTAKQAELHTNTVATLMRKPTVQYIYTGGSRLLTQQGRLL